MEVIDKLPQEVMESICDAGTDLVSELMSVLQRHDLGHEHALAVIAVATAGVALASKADSEQVKECIESVTPMWREEIRPEGRGIVFDPEHRRPGYVQPERDLSQEN